MTRLVCQSAGTGKWGQGARLARKLDKASAKANRPSALLDWTSGSPTRTILMACLLATVTRVTIVILTNAGLGETFALDDETYVGLANAQASGDLSSWSAFELQLWQSTLTYMWPLKVIFEVLGSSAWIAQIYTAAWGVGTVAIATLVATRFLARWAALAVGVTLALLPSQALWSSLVLKDAAVWTLLALLGLLCLVSNSPTPRDLLMSAVAIGTVLWGLGHLRDHTLVVAAWSIPTALAFGAPPFRSARVASGLALAVSVPWFLGLGPGGWALLTDPNLAERRLANAQGALSSYIETEPIPPESSSDELEQIRATLTTLHDERGEIAQPLETTSDPEVVAGLRKERERIKSEVGELEAKVGKDQVPGPGGEGDPGDGGEGDPGGGGSAESVTQDSLDANLKHLPRGLVAMLLEPLPWRTPTSSNMNLARWENLVWYPLLLLAAIGLFGSRPYLRALAFPILVGGGMLIAYALSEGNIGTAYRHRGESVWAIVLLAGLGGQILHERWKRRRKERA